MAIIASVYHPLGAPRGKHAPHLERRVHGPHERIQARPRILHVH